MTVYLTENQILTINKQVINRYSPNECSLLKEPSALNMIVNLPEQYVFGHELYPTLSSKATILFVQLIKKHAFENANKRTAVYSLILFLKLNGYTIKATTEDFVEFTVKVATEELTDKQFEVYVGWIEERLIKIEEH